MPQKIKSCLPTNLEIRMTRQYSIYVRYSTLTDVPIRTQGGITIDDPEIFDGMPVGLQVVGFRNEEEATIAMAEILDNAVSQSLE